MELTVKYFGMLAEITGCHEEIITTNEGAISDFLEVLYNKYPPLRNKEFQVAQNNEITAKNSKISDTEIALLPPFSGG